MNWGYILAIISILLGLIALPFGVFIGRRNRQIPDLRYVIQFDVILDPSDRLFDQGLAMKVSDHPITSIGRTRIALWNHRGDTVRGADIVDSDPLRLQFTDGDNPLQVRTLSRSRPQNKVTAMIDPDHESSVGIAFDFLDAGDGAVLEVVHQGVREPNVLGTLRGAKLRDCGRVKLDSDTLQATRESRLERFLYHTPKYVRLEFLTYIVAAIATMVLLIFLGYQISGPGHLVEPKQFNLDSLTGQADFANAVQDSGNPNASPYAILILPLFVLFIGVIVADIRSFYRNTKRTIPKSIVAAIDSEIFHDGQVGSP